MKDILSPLESQILTKVNRQSQYLELYAKYFAKAKNPERISMTEIDSQGFTIEYYEDSQKKEIRATFGFRIVHPSQVDQALFSMAKEAINALDPNLVDTLYVSPGSESCSLLNSINWFAFSLTLGFLIALWNIRISKDLSPLSYSIKEILYGNQGMDRMFVGIFVIHVIESLFSFCICKFWGDLPLSETVIYMILTIFGGIFVVKGAAKRSSQIQIQRNSKKKS